MAWWRPGQRLNLALAYLIGFFFCWLTLAAFLWIEGKRGSILALVLFVVQELVRHKINLFAGREMIRYLPVASSPSVPLSSGIVAVAFPLVWWLVGSDKKWVRWLGILLLVLLLFMGLYWRDIPNVVFDPAPREPGGWPNLQ